MGSFLQLNITCMLFDWQKLLIFSFQIWNIYPVTQLLISSFWRFCAIVNLNIECTFHGSRVAFENCLLFKWSFCWLCTLHSDSACLLKPVRRSAELEMLRLLILQNDADLRRLTQTLQPNVYTLKSGFISLCFLTVPRANK